MANLDNEIKMQVERYFSALHLHPEGLKGGVFTLMEKNKFKEQYSHGYKKSVDKIITLLEKKERPVFVTLNSYKKDNSYDRYCKRDDKHLWGIDTIMIDIDAPTQLLGVEDELISILQWAWELEKIPMPNLYSYTGSGGVHLYYCIERLPKSMEQSINALKWAIAEKIIEFEDEFPMRDGYTYHVDTKVFDSQRLDRVPGSIHEDTGVMCKCFETGKDRYKYKELLSYCDEETWRADYKIENARKYINKKRGINPQEEVDKKKTGAKVIDDKPTTHQPSQPLIHDALTKDDIRLTQKRVKGLFILAKNGYEFPNCREIACFILRNWLMQLNYSKSKADKVLSEFNSLLKEPLSEKELIQNTRSKKLYKFSNSYLKETLNLTDEQMVVFYKRYRPGDRKERTLIDKVNIAKLLIQGFTSEQICEKLSISLSLLKRRRTEMKKAEGLLYWASYKIEKAEKTVKAIVRQIAEKIGERTVKFREFIECITESTSDLYEKCKEKCSVLLEMLIGHLREHELSEGYG